MPAAGCFLGRKDVHLDPLKHKDAKGTKEFTKREKDVETRRRDEHEDSRGFPIIYLFCVLRVRVSGFVSSCFKLFCHPTYAASSLDLHEVIKKTIHPGTLCAARQRNCVLVVKTIMFN
jgi:hypothetical protein